MRVSLVVLPELALLHDDARAGFPSGSTLLGFDALKRGVGEIQEPCWDICSRVRQNLEARSEDGLPDAAHVADTKITTVIICSGGGFVACGNVRAGAERHVDSLRIRSEQGASGIGLHLLTSD